MCVCVWVGIVLICAVRAHIQSHYLRVPSFIPEKKRKRERIEMNDKMALKLRKHKYPQQKKKKEEKNWNFIQQAAMHVALVPRCGCQARERLMAELVSAQSSAVMPICSHATTHKY